MAAMGKTESKRIGRGKNLRAPLLQRRQQSIVKVCHSCRPLCYSALFCRQHPLSSTVTSGTNSSCLCCNIMRFDKKARLL